MIDPPEDSPDRLDPDIAALEELRRVFARAEGAESAESAESADPSGADPVVSVDPATDPSEPVDHESAGGRRRWWRPRPQAGADVESIDETVDPSSASDSAAIRIVDDDFPDPVYLDGESNSAAVIIDDGSLGAESSGGLPTYTRSSMDPKIRDRRVAVGRALGRRRLRWLVGVVAIAVIVLGGIGIMTSPLFSIEADQVEVYGVVYTDRDALAEIIDDLVGTPTLTVDTLAVERRIEMIPWVLDARVRVRLPRSATIDIAERSPLVTYQGLDGRHRVVDRQGRVLDVIDGQPIAYLLVDTPGAPDLAPGQFTTPGVAAAAELAQALTATVRQRAVRIVVAPDGSELSLFIVRGTGVPGSDPAEDEEIEVVFGAASDILVKLVRLETVLPMALEKRASRIDVATAEVAID